MARSQFPLVLTDAHGRNITSRLLKKSFGGRESKTESLQDAQGATCETCLMVLHPSDSTFHNLFGTFSAPC
jgi:hypothetical protein